LEIWLTFLVFALSVALVVKSADWLTEGASGIASILGVSEIMIGLTIVSFATTAPEFVFSVSASYLKNPDFAVGNAVGSCLCNVGLVLAFVGIAQVTKIGKGIIFRWAIPLLLFAGLVFALSLDGSISRLDGGLILALFVLFYVLLIFRSKRSSRKKKVLNENLKRMVLLFLVGTAGVVIGSRLLIFTGETIAVYFGVPDMIIGITLMAMGTSLPELVTAITSVYKKMGGLSVGNIIGANLLDLAWVISTAAVVNPLTIDVQTLTFTFPVLLILTVVLIGCLSWKRELNRWKGVTFLLIYIGYLVGLFLKYSVI